MKEYRVLSLVQNIIHYKQSTGFHSQPGLCQLLFSRRRRKRRRRGNEEDEEEEEKEKEKDANRRERVNGKERCSFMHGFSLPLDHKRWKGKLHQLACSQSGKFARLNCRSTGRPLSFSLSLSRSFSLAFSLVGFTLLWRAFQWSTYFFFLLFFLSVSSSWVKSVW